VVVVVGVVVLYAAVGAYYRLLDVCEMAARELSLGSRREQIA